MTIYPAIDLSGGQVVRLHRGEMDRKTVYGDDPVAFARRWAEAGADWIHVVDLDGSFAGEPRNLSAVAAVAAAGVRVQVGGGIRTMAAVDQYLAVGVARVILGTSAVRDRPFAEAAMRRLGEQVVIDVGARDGRVAVQGWSEATDLDAITFGREIEAAGARRIIFTDVHSDGALAGPNLPALRRMAEALRIPLIASGGVTTLDDVRSIAEVGVEGVIIGRALYEGTVDLAEAVAVVQ